MAISGASSPRYKACLFLFGNVDKDGKLEDEYAKDEDLSAINHIDCANVDEVESKMMSIVATATENSSPVYNEDNEICTNSLQSIEPVDYYDESELISFDELENSLSLQTKDNDDYDEPVAPQEIANMSVSNAVFEADRLPKISKLPSAPASPVGSSLPLMTVLKSRSEPASPIETRPNSPSPGAGPTTASQSVDASTLIMPPPLHPAPVAASRHFLRGTFPSGKLSMNNDLPFDADSSIQPRVLNTPLGNLLPPEYSNEDITTLYPHYSPNCIPRWGRIMNLPYPPRKYDHLKHEIEYCVKNEEPDSAADAENSNDENISNEPHLIFDDLLDLGEIPTKQEQFEEAEKYDDLRLLQQPADPNENCLAGSSRSWWQVVFAKRLAQLEGSSVDPASGAKGIDPSDKNPRKTSATDASKSPTDNTIVDSKSNTGANKSTSRLCTWRNGPAKFWYDLYNVPADADIEEWDGWLKKSRSSLTVEAPVTLTPTKLSEDKTISSSQTSGSPEEDFPEAADEVEENASDSEDKFYPYQLMQWEDSIIYDSQANSNKVFANLKQNAANAGWVPSLVCRTMASFQDHYHGIYQGVVSSKVLAGQSATPALSTNNTGVIAGAQNSDGTSQAPSTLRPSNTAASSNASALNPLYSIFPMDSHPSFKDGSWRDAIIYDHELPSAATMRPHLLTLDKNDEYSLLDPVENDDEIEAAMAQSSLKKKQPQHMQQDGHINKASFNVTFGYASTRGTLTGALAKAEKGAEKVKRILGKHGLLADGDWNENNVESGAEDTNVEGGDEAANESANLASAAAAASGLPPKDPLNLSNDEYYAVRSGGLSGSLARCGPLQHSTPAVELWPPFFPTFSSTQNLRQFHRVPMRVYTRGVSSQYNVPISVNNLTKMIQRKAREREDEKIAAGGGDIFFMRSPQDLSGCDGDVVLFEYSEEFPPFLNQVGMATRLVNYYRPLLPKDPSLSPDPAANSSPPDLPYGLLVNVGSADSPFLGVVRPGGCLQSMENNMFRAPVFQHKTLPTDFLLIRNKNGLYIRRVPTSFTVGQEVPLMEVPGPNSKRANNFVRDFLTVYILRLFLKSKDEPKRIKMEEIRSAFPNHSESSVRKRLKICADFKRTGTDASWWVLRPEYRMPSEEEIRYLVSPEDFCAFTSMQAAELRLKDAGYGEKSLFVLEENQEENNEEGQPKMEDEVRAAPWNTTRAFLAAQRGGCFLELHGPADPTGCGEAFSYSKTSAKPGALFRLAGGEARGLLKPKNVTGTDADLRKLRLREAREMLRGFGISESELATFKRWEIIDMVRFTSTERAKQGEEEDTAKFARGNRLSMAEQIRCYREECQRIFDLQNRVLSNPELLSTDEEDEEKSSEDDEECLPGRSTKSGGTTIGGIRISSLPSSSSAAQQSARNVQSLLTNRITLEQLQQQQEEAEKEDLKRSVELGQLLIKNRRKQNPAPVSSNQRETDSIEIPPPVKYKCNAESAGIILDLPTPHPSLQKTVRITRTYRKGTSEEYTQTEEMPWSSQHDIYFKILQTSNADQIQSFIGSDEEFKEQKRKEKRRLQDQMRRQRRQQQFLVSRGISSEIGPLRDASGRLIPINRLPGSVGSAPTSSRRKNKSSLFKMRCGACGQTGHMRTNKECPMYGRADAVAPPLPGGSRSSSRRAQMDAIAAQDQKPRAAAQQIGSGSATRYAPSTSGDVRETSSVTALPSGVGHFRLSDDSDDGYDNDRRRRRDLVDNCEESRIFEDGHAKSPDGFEGPIGKFKISKRSIEQADTGCTSKSSAQRGRASNSEGGGRSGVVSARRRSTLASAGDDDYPTAAIKHRGNRRRIDPIVSINHIFEEIYKGLISIPGSKMFMHPVNKKEIPNYYKLIEHPMDLSQIRMKINNNAYQTRREFLHDVNLIRENSENFNGKHSSITEIASKMLSFLLESFAQKENKLMRLEKLANPLMDSDSRVRLSFLLQQIVDVMQNIPNSRAFHLPVDKRRYPDYYTKISNPMDLETLRQRAKANHYKNRHEFMADAELIRKNCFTYNGSESNLSQTAKIMLKTAHGKIMEQQELLDVVEKDILDHLEESGQLEGSVSTDTPRPSSSRETWKRPSEMDAELSLPGDEPTATKRSRLDHEEIEEKSLTVSPLTNYTHDEEDEEHESEGGHGDIHRQPASPHGPSTYVDEDSRLSFADQGNLGIAAEDSQVADALRLSSDSEEDVSDQEGGELIAMDDASNQYPRYSPDFDSDRANDGFEVQSDGDSPGSGIHEESEESDEKRSQDHQCVEFFIGSDEENYNAGE